MPEVAQQTQPEFWRPPVPISLEVTETAPPASSPVCPRCATEYLYGSRFCYTCGTRRVPAISTEAHEDAVAIAGSWQKLVSRLHVLLAGTGLSLAKVWQSIRIPAWLHHFHFDEIRSRIALSTAPLVAFIVGLGCAAGALMVGFLNARTYVDWQAIQFYRAEWLLAAVAAFVAGILLKKAPKQGE